MSETLPETSGELLPATVKRKLMDRIVNGEYKPGERIVELQVAKEFGMSQSPVREALRELAAIGVITISPRRGARVRRPSAKELADVSLVRAEIDALAARIVAPSADDSTVEKLQGFIDVMLEQLEDENFPAVTEADVEFHRLIAVACDNHAVLKAFDQLAPFARTFITLTLPDVDIHGIIDEHRVILDALRAHDADAAADAARQHQQNVSELLQEHYLSE